MTRRKLIASGVLTLWVAGLAVLVYRVMYPNEERRRESLVLLIEPASYYYAIQRNGEHIGYASSQLDTSVFGVQLRNTMVIAGGGTTSDAPDSARSTTQYTAQLSRRLKLTELDVFSGSAPNKRIFVARGAGDVLEVRNQTGAAAPTDTIQFGRLAVTPEFAPLVLALGQTLKPGSAREMEILDRDKRTVVVSQIRVDAESLFVIADSAGRDSTTGMFVGLHSDTVRAWRANFPGAGGGVTWFDKNGRVVHQDLGNGMTMIRTAFELAFENWKLARHITDVPGNLPVPRIPTGR